MVHGAIYQLLAEKSPGLLGNLGTLTFDFSLRDGRWLLCCLLSSFVFRVSGFVFWVPGFGFQVPGFVFRVSYLGFRVSGFEFRVSSFGLGDPV